MANRGLHISGSNWVKKLKFGTWIHMIRSFHSWKFFRYIGSVSAQLRRHLGFLGPPHTSGSNWDRKLKFGVWITACTVVQAVVKATSQSNGKGQFWIPCGSETPKRISMKVGIYNRVMGMPTHANPCGAATTWVVWANTWKKHVLWFLRYTFFTLFFGSRRARTRGPILTIYTSYDVFPPKDVPFGGLVQTAPHFGGKIPQKPQFWGRE